MNIRRTRIATAAASTLVAALALTGIATGAATAAPAKAKATKIVTCTDSNTKVAVSKVSRPVNHLLIKATNKGKTPCYAYMAPTLRFDQDQAATQINWDSTPQAVVTLDPGQTAYASVRTSGGGGHLRTAKKLGVGFANRAGEGIGSLSTSTLPKGTRIDDSAQVTYWQSTSALALGY
ncbi:DUF4232 domain-containing protein [Streptomyces sp. NBC_01089]|uniref:DUF4232 domain-containing protein n=1 Tax=Streptomyces sp. NBC_01089 TaxID=2903747 RepID=UPI0038641F4E|nr:DUF4232 domain-containing protein [Streptomyces sp. NBC_01089]